jgi:RNA polymerase sigma-70 factor (ECF subfamily)
MAQSSQAQRRAVVYCIVPSDLAVVVHEPLRRHFAADATIEVVVEQRWRDRRRAGDRRQTDSAVEKERRQVRAGDGRRVADRRAAVVPANVLAELPRKLRPYVDRLVFVERLEPSSEQLEDRDTARLVARFQAGDSDIFSLLYIRYFDRVYSYLRMVVRDPHDAEDLAQQTFTSVLCALDRYERRRQPFRAWLFRIARNNALMFLQKHSRTDLSEGGEIDRRLEEQGGDAASAELGASWISDRELTMFVERLPLPQRQVLVLRYMLDLSMSQVAIVMDMSPEAVRAAHSRALRRLEQRLRNLGRGAASSRRTPMRAGIPQARVLRRRRFALL